jgi:D-hexose-6-phosphate mutarotase
LFSTWFIIGDTSVQKTINTLNKEFKLLQKQFSKVKDTTQAEKHVGAFLTKYIKIGEDPTDTVIHDKVWDRLLKLTKNTLTEQELNNIWEKKVYAQNTFCMIQ